MKISEKYHILALMLLVFTLLTACHRTELCYDHYPKASFAFSWEQEWERDYGMAHLANWDATYHGFGYNDIRPGIPEWVNLVKFRDGNPDGEHYLSPDFDEILLKDQGGHSLPYIQRRYRIYRPL